MSPGKVDHGKETISARDDMGECGIYEKYNSGK